MGAIDSDTLIGLYNNNKKKKKKKKKSRNIHQQKIIALTHNPKAKYHQDKLENYGINVTPDKNRSR